MRIFSLLLTVLLCAQLPAQGIDFFHGTWEEALEVAKKEDKPIFVDAYASWCGPCKVMAKNVFPQAEVGEVFNANFISLKIDMEKPEAVGFRSENPVRAYPTLFFFDSEGKRIHSVVGGQKAKGLISQARTALGKVDNLTKYEEQYAAGKREPAFMLKYVRALVRQDKPHLKIANDYVRSQNGQLDQTDNLRLLMVAATESDSRIFDKLIEHKASVVALIGPDAFNKQVKLAFLNTQMKAVEMKSADLLDEAVKKYKSIDAVAAEDFALNGALYLANARSDAKAFLKSAKKYHKKSATGDAKKMTDLFQLLSGTKFGSDAKVQDFTAIVGQEAAELKNEYRDYYLLAKWLKENDRKVEALEAAEKCKSVIPEGQLNIHRVVDNLIQEIQKA